MLRSTIKGEPDVASHPVNCLSICAGGGGLDFAVSLLVEAMQAGLMAPAPVWSDATTFRGRPWRGTLDIIFGGIPCQPWSVAGKQAGSADERDLWSVARRLFVQSGAWCIIIENVPGMLSGGGAERVRRDLQRLGCTVEGGLFRASEVGAPHERERLFIVGIHEGRACAAGRYRELAHAGHAGHAGPQGRELCRPPGERDGAAAHGPTSELRGSPLVNAEREGLLPGVQPGIHRSEEGSGPRHGDPAGSGQPMENPARSDRRIHARRRTEGPRTADLGRSSQVVHPLGRRRDRGQEQPERGPEVGTAVEQSGPDSEPVADASDDHRWRRERQAQAGTGPNRQRRRRSSGGGAVGMANADQPFLRGEPPTGQQSILQRDDGLGLFPPGPGDADAWRAVIQRAPHLEPAICRVAYELASGLDHSRIDQLRMLGNGVVPLAGAYAIRSILNAFAAQGSAAAARLVRQLINSPD